EPAAERGAMDRHDDRLRRPLDPREQIVEVGWLDRRIPCGAREIVDVGAGDEGPAGADDDDRPNGRVTLRLIDRGHEPFRNTRAQRVDGRVVDFDDGDIATDGDGYRVRHQEARTYSI